MIIRVEPSGVILKDICEIQTEKCVAKDLPSAITAVWSLPGRRQINACRPCLDEMVRRGEWEVKGARLRHHADIAIFDKEGKVKLVAEVKYSSRKKSSAKRAAEIRQNLLLHSGIPNTQFLLIAFPESFYLWKEDKSNKYDRLADYCFDAKEMVGTYANRNEISLQTMSPLEFELLVSDWLKDLVKSQSPRDSLEWATSVGLYDAIRDGSVVMEVAL